MTIASGGIFEANRLTVATFYARGEPVLMIRSDGSIEVGTGYTPTSAGTLAIDAMRTQLKLIIDQARADEREACARLADEFRELPHGSVPARGLEATWAAAQQIADAIRNRE